MDGEPRASYYDGPDLVERVFGALEASGRTGPVDSDDLVGLDEFHALGRPATLALAQIAQVAAGTTVLDIGAGIGGPARTLARHLGARVTAVDPTARFCALNRALTERAGLVDRVTVVEGGVPDLPFPDGAFDLVWTQAVWQSVPDRAGLVAEAFRVLRPGGRYALFEIAAGPGGELVLPVPWADEPSQSHLVEPDAVREVTTDAGFEVVVWNEGVDVQASIGSAATDADRMASGVPGIDLSLVMPDFGSRMAGLGRNVADQRIALVQAVLRRP